MVPRVLLVTGHAPGTQGVAQLFLHDLVIAYPHDRISCFTVGAIMQSGSPDLEWLPRGFAPRPREGGVGGFGAIVRELSGYVLWQYTRLFKLPAIVRQIVEFGRQQQVEMIWAVMSSPALVCLARAVADELRVPMVTTIWDPPELLMRNGAFSRLAAPQLQRDFGRVLRRSLRCGVASEEMAAEYRASYGITPIVLINGASSTLRKDPATTPRASTDLTIGFAGSFYTKDEWRALLDALAEVNWTIDGRRIRLRVLATRLPFYVDRDAPLEYLGWRPVDEAIEALSQADVLYLPYWFDKKYSSIVRLCFPNKLAAYLAAGKPVFFHGPKDSSPAHFLDRYPAGIACHSNNAEDLRRTLGRFIHEPDIHARAATAIRAALDEELNVRVFRSRFAAMVGIDASFLIA